MPDPLTPEEEEARDRFLAKYGADEVQAGTYVRPVIAGKNRVAGYRVVEPGVNEDDAPVVAPRELKRGRGRVPVESQGAVVKRLQARIAELEAGGNTKNLDNAPPAPCDCDRLRQRAAKLQQLLDARNDQVAALLLELETLRKEREDEQQAEPAAPEVPVGCADPAPSAEVLVQGAVEAADPPDLVPLTKPALRRMVREGLSTKEIARRTGRTEPEIGAAKWKWGIV